MSTADPNRPPVMHDVAQLAGVSHQTVSRVLNDHPSVRPATRERVENAIAQLGYRRNSTARALATRATNTIGVITVDAAEYGPSRTLVSIEAAARAAAYRVHFVSVPGTDAEHLGEALEYLIAASVDGLIAVAPLQGAARSLQGLRTTIPLVEVTILDPATGRPSGVAVDQVSGAAAATNLLLGLGHRTVVHLAGPPQWLDTAARIRGWRQALATGGRPVLPTLTGDWSAASGYLAGRQLTGQVAGGQISAVFVANDQMALGVMSAMHDAGLQVPGDVSVVGFDDIPEAEFFHPALTTVRQDFAEIGRRCIAQMLCLLEGRAPAAQPPIETPIIVRASIGPPPARAR